MTTQYAPSEHPEANLPPVVKAMIPVTNYELIRDILTSQDFTLAGRDQTRPFMLRTISLTEGEEHVLRRRLHAALLRPGILSTRHAKNVEDAIETLIQSRFDAEGRAEVDLVELVFAIETLIMARFVGIDMPEDPLTGVADLVERMRYINDSTSLVWTRNEQVGYAHKIRHQLVDFTDRYLIAAIDRAFNRKGDQLSETVIEKMADAYDDMTWDGELIAREAWTFMAAGVQTSTYVILDALPLLLDWLDCHPEDVTLAQDPRSDFMSRVVSESLRLNVPNPAILRVALRDGETLGGFRFYQGQEFALYTGIANREPDLFGADAEEFNPNRQLSEGLPRWGLSFGHGLHACIGRSLALGRQESEIPSMFEGSTVSVLRALVRYGVSYVDNDPPVQRDDTYKAAHKRFPARLLRDGREAMPASRNGI